ncbi:MAG TPA: hypothetical protein VMT24_00945, partial [Aggregatilineaceae bacterium]|nr:hypothetical protein [Aggregatilineaceae bacterium]
MSIATEELPNIAYHRNPIASASRRAIGVGFVLLILASSGARLLTFDRYLPYLDYGDEMNMYLLGQDRIGVEHDPVVPDRLEGYPPLYIWMNMAVQRAVQHFSTKPWILASDYVYELRLMAALSGIVTVLLISSIGWQIGGP